MAAENPDNLPAPRSPEGQVLIFEDGSRNVQVRLDGDTIWLTQRGLTELYRIRVPTVNHHISAIYEEGELAPEATVRKYLIVRTEGSREVQRTVDHYNLNMTLAIGYRVRSHIGTRFRQWATDRLAELLVKGFTMDDERIKAGQTAGDLYFNELLERIRDIRASERLFYRKITDIYATSIDYGPNIDAARTFFATVQNKLHWAIHGHTAAETIRRRADADKPHMGLSTWKNAPDGPIRGTDVGIAKNYLDEDEIRELNRIVTMYLDYAEDQAQRRNAMRMADWEARLDAFLQFNERNILDHAGTVAAELTKTHAHREFEKYNARRREIDGQRPSDFD
ncbi:MAG: Uncharacterized conserved protein [Candidatus Kentron sp. G]|nr:MAG: Uncharacterized conserved protein [Candidatus Kentron sp. G]